MIQKFSIGLFGTNCYVLKIADLSCVIVDPGGEVDDVVRFMEQQQLTCLGIALTHGHFDHIAGIPALVKFFRKLGQTVSIAVHTGDQDFLGPKAAHSHQQSFRSLGIPLPPDFIATLLDNLPAADTIIGEGDALFGTTYQVIACPGHTAGGVCFYNAREHVILTGDTLFQGGIGRTDLLGGDKQTLFNSISHKILTLPEETRVYPGHGPETTIAYEKQHNPFFVT